MALALMTEDLPVEALSDIVVQGELIVRQSSGSA
jgi:hypothetical protein